MLFILDCEDKKIKLTNDDLYLLSSNIIKLIMEDRVYELKLEYKSVYIDYLIDPYKYIYTKTSMAFLNKLVDVGIYLQIRNELLDNILSRMRYMLMIDYNLSTEYQKYLTYTNKKWIYSDDELLIETDMNKLIENKEYTISECANGWELHINDNSKTYILINYKIDEIKKLLNSKNIMGIIAKSSFLIDVMKQTYTHTYNMYLSRQLLMYYEIFIDENIETDFTTYYSTIYENKLYYQKDRHEDYFPVYYDEQDKYRYPIELYNFITNETDDLYELSIIMILNCYINTYSDFIIEMEIEELQKIMNKKCELFYKLWKK